LPPSRGAATMRPHQSNVSYYSTSKSSSQSGKAASHSFIHSLIDTPGPNDDTPPHPSIHPSKHSTREAPPHRTYTVHTIPHKTCAYHTERKAMAAPKPRDHSPWVGHRERAWEGGVVVAGGPVARQGAKRWCDVQPGSVQCSMMLSAVMMLVFVGEKHSQTICQRVSSTTAPRTGGTLTASGMPRLRVRRCPTTWCDCVR